MDDDGRGGRRMARGNMGKLTNLEAFLSDDAKRGRVWRGEWMDGNAYFKRIDDDLWIMEDPNGPMRICDEQVAAMEGVATWADEPKTLTPDYVIISVEDECKNRLSVESFCGGLAFHFDDGAGGNRSSRYLNPYISRMFVDALREWLSESTPASVQTADEPKTLTPQEALRALADGKCVKDMCYVYKLVGNDICEWKGVWILAEYAYRGTASIVPDPSQPAEPTRPPLKVGDRVKIVGVTSHARGAAVGRCGSVVTIDHDKKSFEVLTDDGRDNWWFDADDIEKIEAEPQVEYPLTYAEADLAMRAGKEVRNSIQSDYTYKRGKYRRDYWDTGVWNDTPYWPSGDVVSAKWRIVDGGK